MLVGHSLGGVIALETAKLAGGPSLPEGTIGATITIDSPLKHASRQNISDLWRVVPGIAQVVCKAQVLLRGAVVHDLANVTDQNRQTISDEKEELVAEAKTKGVRFMTIGNEQDCIWYLTLCGLTRTIGGSKRTLDGDWVDDRWSMLIQNADRTMLYALGTQGCDLAGRTGADLAIELACIDNPHGITKHTASVINDLAVFIGSSPASR